MQKVSSPNFLFSFLLLFLLLGCSNGHGKRITKATLTVFYEDEKDASLADSLAIFWEKQGLITEEKQFIKLVPKTQKSYHLLLIAKDSIDKKAFSFNEVLAFSNLQSDLRVFTKRFFSVVLCDGHFQPIFQPVP
jgi:hypothetical protein